MNPDKILEIYIQIINFVKHSYYCNIIVIFLVIRFMIYLIFLES